MLVELTIQNFAIFDEATIRWSPGLNALTGETGAGKSIIVDAVGVILGDRVGPEVIRSGAERASIEGVFDLPTDEGQLVALCELLAAHGLLEEGEGQLILRRDVSRAGRSVGRVNGRAVPIGLLQQIGELLVDVHGQSQHLSLLRPREHLDYLDRFAGLLHRRHQLSELFAEWRSVQAESRALQEEVRRAERERDLLQHEVSEIEAADLRAGEEVELSARRQRLQNATRLRETVEETIGALSGPEDQGAAGYMLGRASRLCASAARIDTEVAAVAAELERLSIELSDAMHSLRSYVERLDDESGQLEAVEQRLLLIGDLKRRFGDSVPAVLAYLEQARARLDTAERGQELLVALRTREQRFAAELGSAAFALSESRRDASARFQLDVNRELADLGMSGARLEISQTQQPGGEGIDWPCQEGPSRVVVESNGADRVELLFSPSAGEPPQALARIASGGELARVALALKAVLTRVDPRPTLIFDEIDSGVGGRLAAVIGRKLWGLTSSHQVLCITHMPQVAAYADHHLVVSRRSQIESTPTMVSILKGEARERELAEMLGGADASEAAVVTARDMLASSSNWKVEHSARIPLARH